MGNGGHCVSVELALWLIGEIDIAVWWNFEFFKSFSRLSNLLINSGV